MMTDSEIKQLMERGKQNILREETERLLELARLAAEKAKSKTDNQADFLDFVDRAISSLTDAKTLQYCLTKELEK